MFRSFFPSPRLFFAPALLWSVLAVALWYGLGETLGAVFGFAPPAPNAASVIGLGYFTTPQFIWFYLYYGTATVLFAAFWFWLFPHPWQRWSVPGSSAILFSTYFSVQVSVAINEWRRPFFDAVQDALSGKSELTGSDLYHLLVDFAEIAFVAILVTVLTSFCVHNSPRNDGPDLLEPLDAAG